MKNPYLICDIYSGAHDADECDQVISREQVCLSGGDIYDDPSLLRFYPNNDVPPWGNSRIKEEGEDGPDWVIRSQFEDKLANYMMEKNFHLKRLVEMLHKQRNNMHNCDNRDLSSGVMTWVEGTPAPLGLLWIGGNQFETNDARRSG
ncbi:hypothetical protein Tco_0488225 [Tanacetum coccineum]